jgi:hypothetical protein
MAVDVEFHRKEKFADRRMTIHSQRAEEEVVYTYTVYLLIL